jgi:hypothetical protein
VSGRRYTSPEQSLGLMRPLHDGPLNDLLPTCPVWCKAFSQPIRDVPTLRGRAAQNVDQTPLGE